MFLIWIWQLNGLLTSVNKQMSSQITPSLAWLFTLCAMCICVTSLHCGWAYGSSEFHFNQWFFTLGTRVGLFPSVHKQMSAQGSSFAEWLFALCSSTVWLFPTVDEYVLHQFSSLSEWLFALCTSVGILPSVNEHMSAQISSLAGSLFAFCALVWFLSTMGEQLSMCQIMWLRNCCTRCICPDSFQCVFWCNISTDPVKSCIRLTNALVNLSISWE